MDQKNIQKNDQKIDQKNAQKNIQKNDLKNGQKNGQKKCSSSKNFFDPKFPFFAKSRNFRKDLYF